jgi:hypothetical protein
MRLHLNWAKLDFGGEKMNEKTTKNRYDPIAWGVFIILLGVGWFASAYYQISTTIYIAIGAGIILIALNIARWRTRLGISKFSLFIGLIMLALSGPGLAGVEMPFIPTLIALIGLFIVAEAVQKLNAKKSLQATETR